MIVIAKSVRNLTEDFRQAIGSAGIEPPAEIITDGRLHRFHVSGDRPRTENGWYVLHGDDPAAGAFGCWKRGISETWCSREYRHLSAGEKERLTAYREAVRGQREEEAARVHAECRKTSENLWDKAHEASADHPYLMAKGVKPTGIRQIGSALVVPVQDYTGTLHGLQFIGPDGSKRFKAGTNKTGHFCALHGDKGGPLLICEGYATSASLHETTGCSVAVAYDAANLQVAAKVSREKMPKRSIVICSGDDQWTEGNPGRTKATAEALSN